MSFGSVQVPSLSVVWRPEQVFDSCQIEKFAPASACRDAAMQLSPSVLAFPDVPAAVQLWFFASLTTMIYPLHCTSGVETGAM